MAKVIYLFKQKSWLLPVMLAVLYLCVIAVIYHQRVASFIFFDEYANYISAYFMGHGRPLYSQNFSNHQMLPIYISYFIQHALHPSSLYSLYLYHRLFIILFSFVCGIFLTVRMKWIGLGFIVIFELSKYYLFGNLFLAESMIVYPLVYLFYLSWQRLNNKKIAGWEIVITGILTWFVIFSREPYIPLVLLLYAVILCTRKISRYHLISLIAFFTLSLVTILTVPIKEYIYQVMYVSYATVFLKEVHSTQGAGLGPLAILFYPIVILIKGQLTFFRWVLMLLSGLFLLTFIVYLVRTKKIVLGLYMILVLAFANLRPILPGTEFYSGFHIIQWYALFIVSICILISQLQSIVSRRLFSIFIIGLVGVFLFLTVNPQSFLWDKFNAKNVFSFQYDMFYVNGQAIKLMAKPNSTMFVDMSDSLLFWTAGIPSSYTYGVYYPVMDAISTYKNKRLVMFQNNPPDFYYVNCLEGIGHFNRLPHAITMQYAPLTFNNSPTCFLVRKDILKNLSDEQVSELESLRFSIDNRLRQNK